MSDSEIEFFGASAIATFVLDAAGYYIATNVETVLAEINRALLTNVPAWNLYVNSLRSAGVVRIDGDSIQDGGGTEAIGFDGTGEVDQIGSAVPAAGDVLTWSAVMGYWVPAAAGGGVPTWAQVLGAGNQANGINVLVDEGSDIIVYSDNLITEVARIDGATGNITTIGTVDGVDISTIAYFKTITGITNDVVADIINDTLTLASANAILTIVGTAATDTITFTVVQAQIDHDALTNFAADEHIAHSGVSIIAGAGMAGGGTIAASRTLDCSITQYTDALAKTACVSDAVYAAGWDGVLDVAPSKNAVYDYVSTLSLASHLHDAQTLQMDGVNSDGGAFSFSTSGAITFNQQLILTHTVAGMLDLNPANTGTQNVIDITPSAALVAGSTWKGVNINAAALDPATGAASGVYPFVVQGSGFVSVDGNAAFQAFRVDSTPAADTNYAFIAYITEMTANKTHGTFYSYLASVLSKTATYVGLRVDWSGATRDAEAPVLQGVNVQLPADYTSFGANFAGYFSGGGYAVKLCDATYAIDATGAVRLTGAVTGITSITLTGAIATATTINMTGELDLTGSGALIDLNPAGTGSANIIDITPTAALVAGSTWRGEYIVTGALDPATGVASLIIGSEVYLAGTDSVDANATLVGYRVLGATTDVQIDFASYPIAKTDAVSYTGYLNSSSMALGQTQTNCAIKVGWTGVTRTANAPIIQGLNIQMPADYTNFGTSFAGYFSGDGRTVTICDTTYAIDVSGATRLVGVVGVGRAFGAVGATAGLEVYGTDSNIAGAHQQFVTSADNYPLMQLFNWAHDNVHIMFDAYFDGTNWRSSDAGSNYGIVKGDTTMIGATDRLAFVKDSGIAQGGIITWDVLGYFDTTGNFTLTGAFTSQGLATVDGCNPEADLVDDLGSATLTWHNIFVSHVLDPDGTNIFTFSGGAITMAPVATGSFTVINMTPAPTGGAGIDQGSTWTGFYMSTGLLDPKTGTPSTIVCFQVSLAGTDSVDADATLYGFSVNGSTTDTQVDYASYPQAKADAVTYYGYLNYFAGALGQTQTNFGVRIDWASVTRTAGAPILYGIYVSLPAAYGSFGANLAGYFSGGGEAVSFCDGTYAINADGPIITNAGIWSGNIVSSGTITAAGDFKASGSLMRLYTNGIITMEFDDAVSDLTAACDNTTSVSVHAGYYLHWTQSSKAELKDNIIDANPIELEKQFNMLQPRLFKWKHEGIDAKPTIGFIAEEAPDFVRSLDGEGKLVGIDTSVITTLLVNKVKILESRIQTLEANVG